MDNNHATKVIADFCEASFVEVFQNQSCLVYRAEDGACLPDSKKVVIDASAEELKLLMVLTIPDAVLKASYPVQSELSSLSSEGLSDWYHELANRLMGSLKNRVVIGTGPMQLGLPREGDESFLTGEFDKSHFVFECDGAPFGCTLGTAVLGEIDSLEQSEVDCMDGELELF